MKIYTDSQYTHTIDIQTASITNSGTTIELTIPYCTVDISVEEIEQLFALIHPELMRPALTEDESDVLQYFSANKTIHTSEKWIHSQCDLSPASINAALVMLQLKGYIQRVSDNQYRRLR